MAVRRERVILDLQDDFSSGMVRAAGATAMLRRELRDLDGMSVRITQTFNDNTRGVDQFSRSLDQSGRSIDRYSGRLAALAQAGLVFGPGAIPVTAVATAGVAGLASQLGFAAIGMGSLVVATRGVGDALKAVNAAAIEPTAKNLEKARQAMADLAPETQAFVRRLHELRPVLGDIRDAAAAGWFPGLTESLDYFELVAPRVASLFETIGSAGGNLLADGAEALAGGEWAEFISFVEAEGPEALDQFGRSVGNVVQGLAELWMAFDPLNDDFSNWLLEASRGFNAWADGLDETEGFQDFIEYVREAGPQVERTLGAIAEATVAIVKAASPLGGPVLAAFEVIADALKTIADSPLGTKIFTMAAAFVVLNKTLAVTAGLLARTGFISAATAGRISGAGTGTGPGPVGGGGPTPVPIMGRLNAARTGFAQFRTDLRDLRGATLAQRNASTALIAAQARVNATMKTTATTAAKGAVGIGAFAVATGAAGESLGLQNTAMLGLVGYMAGPWGAALGAGIGLVADITAANRRWEESLKQIHAALASGDVAQIEAANQALRERLAILRDRRDVSGVGDFFSDYLANKGGFDMVSQEDFDQVRIHTRELSGSLEEAAAGFGNVAAQASRARAEVEDLRQEFINFGTVVTKQGQWRAYQEAIDNFTKSLKENGRTLDEGTAKGRANAQALEDIATAAVAFSQNLSGADRVDFLKQARRAFVDAAEKAGGLDKQSRELLKTLNALIGEYPIKIDADTREAARRIRRIREEAKTVEGDYRMNFIVTQTNADNKRRAESNQGIGPVNPADGGTIPWGGGRPRRAMFGNTVPKDGGPYADRYPYLLAPGEEVISNRYGQADRHRSLLKAINANKLADGGTAHLAAAAAAQARAGFAAMAPVAIDYDRLAAAMERARPLYGDVYMQPHDYNEFRREQDEDRRRMARGGFGR